MFAATEGAPSMSCAEESSPLMREPSKSARNVSKIAVAAGMAVLIVVAGTSWAFNGRISEKTSSLAGEVGEYYAHNTIGCSNWQDIQLSLATYADKAACAAACTADASCKSFDWQETACEPGHPVARSCYLFKNRCVTERNPCWEINFKAGPSTVTISQTVTLDAEGPAEDIQAGLEAALAAEGIAPATVTATTAEGRRLGLLSFMWTFVTTAVAKADEVLQKAEEWVVSEEANKAFTSTLKENMPATVMVTGDTVTASEVDKLSDAGDVSSLAAGVQAQGLNMTIIHMNDHHSHLVEDNFKLDVSALDLQTEGVDKVKVSYGGFPRLVSLLHKLNSTGENVVKIHAGDATTGTMYFPLFKGEADAELMNHFCFDMMGLGNHEFDDGDETLANFIDMLQGQEDLCSATPVIAANVVPGPSSPLAGKLVNYTIKTFGNGEIVGFIGIDSAKKVMAGSNPSHGTVLTDDVVSLQWNIDKLRSESVNKIVVVSHIGYAEDLEMAGKLSGVDVIIGADSHTLLNSTALPPSFKSKGPYPTLAKDADGADVCIVQAWEYAHAFGELHVSFDAAGGVIGCIGSPRIPVNAMAFDAGDVQLSPDDTRAVSDFLLEGHALVASSPCLVAVPEDKGAKAALEKFRSKLEAKQARVVGTVTEDLCFNRIPGVFDVAGNLCPLENTYKHGSDIHSVVVKAFLDAAGGADFCIMNAGTIRSPIAKGKLTYKKAYRLLPFPNTLVLLTMTGAQIKQVLEDALEHVYVGGATSAYPYAAGLRFKVDASQEKGSRVSDLEANPHVASKWSAIKPSQDYTVVTNDYIGKGKDGYLTFASVADSKVELHTVVSDAMIQYLEHHPTLSKLPYEEYSTQEYIDEEGNLHE